MLTRNVRVAVLAALLTAGSLGPSGTAHATAGPEREPGSCYATVDSPHYSSGAGGVIAKVRFRCDAGYSMTVTSIYGNVYYCGSNQPTGTTESQWTNSAGCRPVSSVNSGTDFYVGPGATVTRYIPATGGAVVRYKGWYIACIQYGRAGVSGSMRNGSSPAYVTPP